MIHRRHLLSRAATSAALARLPTLPLAALAQVKKTASRWP